MGQLGAADPCRGPRNRPRRGNRICGGDVGLFRSDDGIFAPFKAPPHHRCLCLAGLYAMRVVAGRVATEIELSVWLLAFSIFFFYALAAIKRQAELVDSIGSGKVTVHRRGYRPDDVLLLAPWRSPPATWPSSSWPST